MKKFFVWLFLLSLFVTSCNTPVTSSPNDINQSANIDVQITGLELKEIGTETIPQQNCAGTAEVENVVEKTRTIAYTIEVQNGVSVNASGQVGFAGTDVELGATVASQFGQSYGASQSISRSISVKASPGSYMQHVIRQVEVWKTGQAKISVGGQQTTIPFKFRSDFAIELVGSSQIQCPTDSKPTSVAPTVVISDTQAPGNFFNDTDPSSILSVGDTWTTGGLSVQLRKAEFLFGDEMDLYFEFANNSGKTIFFNLNENVNVTLRDDKGQVYTWDNVYKEDVVMENGETYSEEVFKGGNFSGAQYFIIELNLPGLINAKWRYN